MSKSNSVPQWKNLFNTKVRSGAFLVRCVSLTQYLRDAGFQLDKLYWISRLRYYGLSAPDQECLPKVMHPQAQDLSPLPGDGNNLLWLYETTH